MLAMRQLLLSLAGTHAFRLGPGHQLIAVGNETEQSSALRRQPYDFSGDIWTDVGFDDRWEMFRNEVPLSELQRHYDNSVEANGVCLPTLEGPSDSSKLVILLHGWLACPGSWFRIVPLMIQAGFRVLRPTLPGHGRHCKGGEEDLEHVPTDSKPYLHFADALGRLAEQFKREHPNGLIVAAGHSLGGLATAKYALERPRIVDRVLLINPAFAVKSSLMTTASRINLNVARISKGRPCTSSNSGGYQQFRFTHLHAMVELAYIALCCQWGIPEACAFDNRGGTGARAFNGLASIMFGNDVKVIREESLKCPADTEAVDMGPNFAKLRDIQVLTSIDEPMVNNWLLEEIVKYMQSRRGTQVFDLRPKRRIEEFCYWPEEFGHSYLSNRDKPGKSPKWWHPYVEQGVANFLIDGRHIDQVSNGDFRACLTKSKEVDNRYLAILPAVQRVDYYITSHEGIQTTSDVLYSGYADKETEWWSNWNRRYVEVLQYGDSTTMLITTRLKPDDNIRDLFSIKASSSRPEYTQVENKQWCLKLYLNQLDKEDPLHEEVEDASSITDMMFCGEGVMRAICANEVGRMTCK